MFMNSIYAVSILFNLTFSDIFNIDPNLMSQIDLSFLTFFFVEIIMKVFASSSMFFADFFKCFDASIVVISEFLSMMGIVAKSLGVYFV